MYSTSLCKQALSHLVKESMGIQSTQIDQTSVNDSQCKVQEGFTSARKYSWGHRRGARTPEPALPAQQLRNFGKSLLAHSDLLGNLLLRGTSTTGSSQRNSCVFNILEELNTSTVDVNKVTVMQISIKILSWDFWEKHTKDRVNSYPVVPSSTTQS